MFNWLARKGEGPLPARVPLAFLQDVRGRGADVPRSYEARVQAAVHENPVAARALRLVAEAVGAAPLTVGGGEGEVAALMMAPNPRASGSAFLEKMAAHLVLHGNAYVEAAEGGNGKAAELYTLAPERVRIETDARGWPEAFLYQTGTGDVRLPAPVADAPGVLHLRALSPCDDLYGLGMLEAASGAVAAHNEAARWNRALLANSARPSGALVFEPKDGGNELSAEQLSRLRGELDEGFAGARRAGRPLLLEGGLKWQSMAMSPADMDFAAGQAAAARDIALALGVPPMLLGLPGDNTYANYAEANRALWRLTVLPLAGRICEALSGWLKTWWADAELRVDLDRVPALSADRAEMWKRVSAADFLTADEKKNVLGIG